MKVIKNVIGILIIVISFNSCEINDNAEGVLSPYISIYDLKSLYTGENLLLTKSSMKAGSHLIRGIVISDSEDKNREVNTLVIQDDNKGIIRGIAIEIKENTIHQYKFGDSLLIDLRGKYLKKINGRFRITGVVSEDITILKSNINVAPREVNLSVLTANYTDYEYTLVKFFSLTLDEDNIIDDDLLGFTNYKIGNLPLKVYFEDNSDVIGYGLPWSASFVGVVRVEDDDLGWSIWPRSIQDISEASGAIYSIFPETFDIDRSVGYTPTSENLANFSSGTWGLYNTRVGDSDNDRKNGAKALRTQRESATDSYAAMKFDLMDGASKVSFLYGSTAEDSGCYYRLEYSQDEGVTWIPVTAELVYVNNKVPLTATYMLDIVGKVRFRIFSPTKGANVVVDNGRMNIDDFAVFKAF